MLLKDDKRKMAGIIIKRMVPNAPESERESKMEMNDAGDQIDREPGIDAAVDEMMQAIESKNRSMFKMSLKSLMQLMMDECEGEDS